MTANPEITYVIATKSGTTVKCLITVRNTLATSGMVQTLINEYSSGTCIPGAYKGFFSCLQPSVSTYISNVHWLLTDGIFTPTTMPSTICVRTYQCTSNEDCPGLDCGSYSTSPYWTKNNIIVNYGLNITPNAITNSSVTPGNSYLVFKWNNPTNASVTINKVSLYRGTTLLQTGYIFYDTSSGLSVDNLTNGTTYRLEVSALSDDGLYGSTTQILGIPNIPCTTPSCGFALT